MTIRRMSIVCWVPKDTNTHSEYVYLLLFHCNNGYENSPQCYIIRTLPFLLTSFAVHGRMWLQSFSTYVPSTYSFHFLPPCFCVAFCLTACLNAKYLYTALVFCYTTPSVLKTLWCGWKGEWWIRKYSEGSCFGLVEVHFACHVKILFLLHIILAIKWLSFSPKSNVT